jgi:branched-chain amino acid transport system substrate-binding protein
VKNLLFAAIPLLSLVATSPSTQAADRTGITDKTIKIGMFGPLSGSAIIGAKALYGAAAIYKDVNDKHDHAH